jgi:hypothetical protein
MQKGKITRRSSPVAIIIVQVNAAEALRGFHVVWCHDGLVALHLSKAVLSCMPRAIG